MSPGQSHMDHLIGCLKANHLGHLAGWMRDCNIGWLTGRMMVHPWVNPMFSESFGENVGAMYNCTFLLVCMRGGMCQHLHKP